MTDRKPYQPSRAVCDPVFRTMVNCTHPKVVVTLARCERDLALHYTNSEREKREKEGESHLAGGGDGGGEKEELMTC